MNVLEKTSFALLALSLINFSCIPLFSSWSGRVLAANKDFGFQITVDIVGSLAMTVWLFSALVLGGVRQLETILVGMTGIAAATAIVKLIRVLKIETGLGGVLARGLFHPRAALQETFSHRYRGYFGPFFLSAVSGFLKDLFPVLVVGAVGSPKAVAEFRVVQQLFRVVGGVVPNAFELVRPGLVDATSSHGSRMHFLTRYLNYARGYLAVTALFGLGIVLALEPVMGIWSLDPSPVMPIVAGILAAEMLYGAATHIEFQLFLLGEKTGYLVFMSLVRQLIAAVVTVVGGFYFGQLGVAVGAMTGALWAWLGFTFYAVRKRLRPVGHLREMLIVIPGLTLLIAAAAAISYELNVPSTVLGRQNAD